MTDQHPFLAHVAPLTQTTVEFGRVSIAYLPPRTEDATDQIDALLRSGEVSPSRFVFGAQGAGHSTPIPRTEAR
jgi:hypothetical protein